MKKGAVTRSKLKKTFLKNQDEEMDCLNLRRLPRVGSRAASKLWRYKSVNFVKALNLSNTHQKAVEFRAWDFMDPELFVEAVELSR